MSQEFEEELESSENVSEELRKVMDLDATKTDESTGEETPDHPAVPPTPTPGSNIPMPHPAAANVLGGKPLLGPLTQQQPPMDVRTGPLHSGSRGQGVGGGGGGGGGKARGPGSGLPIPSPLSPVSSKRDPLPVTKPQVSHAPAQSSAAEENKDRKT